MSAEIRLPQLISDRMVLQRNTELKIWGWADQREKVTVRFRGNVYHTEADKDGKWVVAVAPQVAGGPFMMEVNEITIRDILIGDVWLASGQSNMETPIERLVDRYPEINLSNNHMIRYFKVPVQESPSAVKDEVRGGAVWHSAIASDVMNWTALAYFYAQEAYRHTGVPTGVVVASKGGTEIQGWISSAHLKRFPADAQQEEAYVASQQAQLDQGIEKWHRVDWNDLDWPTWEVPGRWFEKGLSTKGVVWYRRDFAIPPAIEGRHAKLYLGMLIDRDSVFVNGHFIGATPYMYPPRKYDIPAGILKAGKNNITIRLRSDSGDGGFVADKSYKLVSDEFMIDLTGTWKYKVGLDLTDVQQYRKTVGNWRPTTSRLYNGMIYPLRDYAFKGVIWYQGESNTGEERYAEYLAALIADWRALYRSPALPCLLVQLPNFLEKPSSPNAHSGWAMLRDAQFKTALSTPHTALAVTYDVGEWNDIHPLNKKDVAYRLFLAARKIAFNENIVSSGPQYRHMEVEGSKIVLTFTETGSGLTSAAPPLKHFAIAGHDRQFFWADAVIKGNKVIVSSPHVDKPVAVRYGWSNNPVDANLKNKEGLLASPFRTDNW